MRAPFPGMIITVAAGCYEKNMFHVRLIPSGLHVRATKDRLVLDFFRLILLASFGEHDLPELGLGGWLAFKAPRQICLLFGSPMRCFG